MSRDRPRHPASRGPWAVRALAALALLAVAGAPARGQWVEPPGEGWVDVTVYHHDTRERYTSTGDTRAFFADGRAVATSAYVTAAAGLLPGVDAWVQAPVQRLEFTDVGGERVRSGLGDTRLYLRASPTRWLGFPLPLAVRGGVKLPVGDFSVDSEVIPLGDGQRDWELMLEAGHSFHPVPVYVNGWIGYRWRERNGATRRDFGDEAFFLVQAGGSTGVERLGFRVILEGWEGGTPVIEGVSVPSAARRMLQVTPSLQYPVGPGIASLGARAPLTGENLPAGTALVVGYFVDWTL